MPKEMFWTNFGKKSKDSKLPLKQREKINAPL
jgi:hypothetical protein